VGGIQQICYTRVLNCGSDADGWRLVYRGMKPTCGTTASDGIDAKSVVDGVVLTFKPGIGRE
jgi:hypothetical protein